MPIAIICSHFGLDTVAHVVDIGILIVTNTLYMEVKMTAFY